MPPVGRKKLARDNYNGTTLEAEVEDKGVEDDCGKRKKMDFVIIIRAERNVAAIKPRLNKIAPRIAQRDAPCK